MGLIDPRVNLSWSGGEGSKVASSELGRLTDRLMSRDRVTHSRGNRRSLIILSKMGAGVDGVYAIIDRVRHSGLGQPRENFKNVYYVGLWIMYVQVFIRILSLVYRLFIIVEFCSRNSN